MRGDEQVNCVQTHLRAEAIAKFAKLPNWWPGNVSHNLPWRIVSKACKSMSIPA